MYVGGQEWQLWKAKFSSIVPLLPVVEKAGSPAAEFSKENLFVCICCCLGFIFLRLCLCQLPLAIQCVGFLD